MPWPVTARRDHRPGQPGGRVVGSTVKITAAVTNCDTAVFSEEPTAGPDGFTVTANPDGSVTVADNASVAAGPPFPKGDGVDTLWNIENLRFCIGTDAVPKKCDAFKDVLVTPPAAPVIGTATAGNARATVNFTAGSSRVGTSPTTSFTIQVFAGAATTPTTTITGISPTATSQVVTGLTNGTSYKFKVIAVNKFGSSAPSAFSNSVTPVIPRSRRDVDRPGRRSDRSLDLGGPDGHVQRAGQSDRPGIGQADQHGHRSQRAVRR